MGRLLHLAVHRSEFMSVSAQSLLWSAPEITCLTGSWSTRKYRNSQVYELCCTLQHLILEFSVI